MKNLTILLFAICPIFLFSQTTSKLDVFASLDYGHRILTNAGLLPADAFSTKGKFNYHFGANYYHRINESAWIKIGVGFASLGDKTGIINLRYGSQHDGMGGFDPQAPSGESYDLRYKHNYQFLEIPIAIRYEFLEKRITPYFEVGVSPMYYLSTRTRQILNGEPTIHNNKNSNFGDFHFAAIASFGVSYQLSEKLDLFVQPNLRYHINKLSKEAVVGTRFYSGGLAVGAMLNLN